MDNKKLSAEEQIEKNGEYLSLTVGISMRPLLREGKDIARVVKAERPLKKFDVALYRAKKGNLVLHRIIKETDTDYIFRGDNLISTETIAKERVIGVLKEIYRNKKHLINCENPSALYKFYTFINYCSFPIRKVWRKAVTKNLRKLKAKIKKSRQ
ncbi:MAG: hypothetical protein MJ090_03210 [Clostridia bacterium]|nr:hypothetical protein [Clostridia bacterium]